MHFIIVSNLMGYPVAADTQLTVELGMGSKLRGKLKVLGEWIVEQDSEKDLRSFL